MLRFVLLLFAKGGFVDTRYKPQTKLMAKLLDFDDSFANFILDDLEYRSY